MLKRLFYIIPMFFLEMAIQLTFLSLSPNVKCRWFVYGIITFATMIHISGSYVLLFFKRIRKSAAVIVAGSIVQFIMICMGYALMAGNAGIKKAVITLIVLLCIYFATVSFFLLIMEEDGMFNGIDDHEDTDEQDNELGSSCTSYTNRPVPPPLPTR